MDSCVRGEAGNLRLSCIYARKQGESVSKALGAVKGCHEEILAFHFAISAIHALARGVGDGVEYIHRATLQRIDVN